MKAQNDICCYPVGQEGLGGDAQLLQDELTDAGGVGLAAGGLHDSAHDGANGLDLAAADLLRHRRVGGERLGHGCFQSRIVLHDSKSACFDDRVRITFTGEYTDTETEGTYACKACGSELFTSDTKFHSGCGWPSFYQPMTDTVEYIEDNSGGMKRVEVRCATCGSHLGHVFPDGFGTPTGDRFCINSISITLNEK